MKPQLAKKSKAIGVWLCVFAFGYGAISHVMHRSYVSHLMQPGLMHGSPDDLVTSASEARRQRQFCAVWAQRERRDIGPELVPFIDDSSPGIRWNAARAFAHLESAAGEKSLAVLLRAGNKPNEFDERLNIAQRFALGRIRARHQKGRAKMKTILRTCGLTWGDVVQMSQKLNTDSRTYRERGAPGYHIVNYVAEVLYEMRRRGDNVDDLVAEMTLNRPQQVMLRGAGVSVEDEVNLIVDWAFLSSATDSDDALLYEDHIPLLGRRAADQLIVKMKDVLRQPQKYPETKSGTHRTALFKMAVATNDRRFLALFAGFEKDKFIGPVAGRYRRILADQQNFGVTNRL